MRLHKVYHRFSLYSLSSPPFLLPPSSTHYSPPFLLSKRCRISSSKTRNLTDNRFIQSMSTSRLHNLVPVGSIATEDAGGHNGSLATSEDDDELNSGYRLPPPEIRDIVDAPPLPSLSFSPKRDKILFLKRRSLPPLSELAKAEDKLAGIRIDGNSNTRSRMSFYTGIGVHGLKDDGTLGPEKLIHGFPEGSKINFVNWSTDGKHLAFSIRQDQEDGSGSKLRVWVADVETGIAKPLFQSPDVFLNAVFDNYVWVNDSTLLVCTIPASRGSPPKKPVVPSGPKIQSNEQKSVVQARTYQDLLKDEYDEDLFEYYATSQLVLVSLDGTVKLFGEPSIYTSLDPSPDDKYILLSSIHRPFSFNVPCGRFPKKVDLWSADGKFMRTLCDLPVAEDIPIAFNSVRKGMRSLNWRADKPSDLYWVETQDGGDAKVEVSPRDIVYTQAADAPEDEKPTVFFKLDLRYGGISWCDDSLALVYESWYKTRRVRTWLVAPGSHQTPRLLFDRSSEDVYSDPGSPMLRRTPTGTYIIAKFKKEDKEGTYLLLNGSGATPEGNIPFLDLFDIDTGDKERIWQSDKEKYYESVVALMSDQTVGDLKVNELKVLTSKESKTENTQYYLQQWPDKKSCQITSFPHPYPQLASLQKEMIRYQRRDGVQLTATLYLPPGYDPSRDGPLPCLIWSYPGEFKNKEAAGQVRGSPNEFAGIGPTSPLLWLARKYAILSGPTIPIIGEGKEEANDTYVEQLVGSAEAAVEEVIRRGVAHPDKIAIGGHSYGAFMTANLLAHAPHLFCCGIARSGAYNRTLTPFGFQNEDRTLWEATDTYIKMSPFMAANKIKKPILLIHGEEDNNSGTLTMQSDRFFNALKGHGALSRPCVFPDFTQEKARSWWVNLVKDFVSNGVDGIWNDMNEPAVFKSITKTMPESNVHRGDTELGGRQNHSHYHNVYGMLMARSTYTGMKLANPNKRPFVLTRAGFIGSQRYAATWTGDNLSTWEHLHMSISMVLQLGLSGQPLSGPDIGGFAGNATPKLFGRWLGVGAMFPFCRGHSEKGTTDHEPWSFGEECEEVCRLALKRRYRLIPHIYTLFYLAHTKGLPVAAPAFFSDPKNSQLKTNENSFLLGPLLVYASTVSELGVHQLQHALPNGTWMSFDFEDSHPDLPALYLQGGSIIPFGPPHQHVGEAKLNDDLSLLVALDEDGKAEGVLFEDDGDGYEYTNGGYLLTTYIAELKNSVVTVKIFKTEGLWARPNRRLHVHLLLGEGAMIDAWGTDGEDLQIVMPSENELPKLISASKNNYKTRMETAKLIPDVEKPSGHKGVELSGIPVEIKSGEWALKVVPWIGGRIISMHHLPTGTQWLHSRVEMNGYEEYSGTEYRSAGCTEQYTVLDRDLEQAGEIESLKMEGDVGGGLAIERTISISQDNPKAFTIDSSLVARNVGAGSGGFSRLVCLRIHPTFSLLHPTESYISFTAIDGSKHDVWPESGEQLYEGDLRPNGEWMLVDKCLKLGLVNKFNIDQVYKCLIHWDFGTVNLELWSEDRPVSKQSPLRVSHSYEVRRIP